MAQVGILDFQAGFGMLATQNRIPGPPWYSRENIGGRVLLYCMYQVLYDKSLFYADAVASPSTNTSAVFSSACSC